MSTLDSFFGTKPPPPEERCSNPKCKKKLSPKDAKYTLTVKGKENMYCPACAKEILHPHEENEEAL